MSIKDAKQQLESERIDELFNKFGNVYSGVLFTLVAGGLLIYDHTPNMAIVFWVGFTLLSYAPRLWVTYRYHQQKRKGRLNPQNITQWEDRIFMHSFLPFIAFSSIAFLPYPENTYTGVLLATLILLGLIIGGVMTYNVSGKILLLYLGISQTSIILRCLYESSYDFYALILFCLAISLLVSKIIRQQFDSYIKQNLSRIQFEKAALTDPLTGLANRRQMELFMSKFFAVSKRANHEFQVIMIDIDHFKRYNDRHGHLAGDKMLVSLARLLTSHIRKSDLLVRYGGEEFTLILTINHRDEAIPFILHLLAEIEEQLGITVSAGLAGSDQGKSFKSLLALADQALYTAKHEGRNRLICTPKVENANATKTTI